MKPLSPNHVTPFLASKGGHLEMGESWEQTAIREMKEETNLELLPDTVKFVHVTNDVSAPSVYPAKPSSSCLCLRLTSLHLVLLSPNQVFDPHTKHYITLLVSATASPSAPLVNLEPHKCDGWIWVPWSDLKTMPEGELFLPLRHAVHDTKWSWAPT